LVGDAKLSGTYQKSAGRSGSAGCAVGASAIGGGATAGRLPSTSWARTSSATIPARTSGASDATHFIPNI
jgi:hypothetical protein